MTGTALESFFHSQSASGTAPSEERKAIEAIGLHLRLNQVSDLELKDSLNFLAVTSQSDNPWVASTGIIEFFRTIQHYSQSGNDSLLKVEQIGQLVSAFIEGVGRWLSFHAEGKETTISPLEYVVAPIDFFLSKLPFSPELNRLRTQLSELRSSTVAYLETRPDTIAPTSIGSFSSTLGKFRDLYPGADLTPISENEGPLRFHIDSKLENPISVCNSLEQRANMIVLNASKPSTGISTENKALATQILGHSLDEIISVTSHGKVSAQFFDGIHFLQLPILSFSEEADSPHLLKKIDLTILVAPHGLVVIDPSNGEFTKNALALVGQKRVPSHRVDTPVATAIHLFEQVLEHNKETILQVDRRVRTLISATRPKLSE
ncbi:MAG: hypothetical protein KDD53_10785, partial [Bdellovibrionales bacterium]|nr:hypothetical protein [Bdellovibrionales bacterium]